MMGGSTETAYGRRHQVYGLISAAAERGAACPFDPEIARAVGYANASSVSRAIRGLVENGMIRRHNRGVFRVIEIVETGKCTASRRPEIKTEPSVARRSVRHIVETVARTSGLTVGDILGHLRFRIFIRPRVIACHFARAEGWTYEQIGQALGKRDHSTVRHSCLAVATLLEHDKLFARLFRRTQDALADILPPTFTIVPRLAPDAPTEPQSNARHPLEIDEEDDHQVYDLATRQKASAQLLSALQREHPERFVA